MGSEGDGQVGILPTGGHLKCLETFWVVITGECYCHFGIDSRDVVKPLPTQRTDPPLQTKKGKS